MSKTAADLMQRDLVVVAPGDTLREAMELMTENHIAGLPVVDARGRCVGMISASDILLFEQENAEFISEANEDVAQHFDPETQRWESVRFSSFSLEEFGDVNVEEVMARDLVFVRKSTPVVDVARTMLGAKVHRVLVLGDGQQLYGLISATDFVRLYADSNK